VIISLRRLTYNELKNDLNTDDKIVVWACNNCIKFCDGLGGREAMNNLADKLATDGYAVVRRELIGCSCLLDLVQKRKTDEATTNAFNDATVIIPLTCEDGYENVKHTFDEKRVLNVTKTIGLGVFSTKTGMCINYPFEATGLLPSVEGMSLKEAAEKLNLHAGPFETKAQHHISEPDMPHMD
jgi:hypothetical protein